MIQKVKSQNGFIQHLAARLSAAGRYISPKEKDSPLGAGFIPLVILLLLLLLGAIIVVFLRVHKAQG